MTLKKSLAALAIIAGVTVITASAPALAGPCLVTEAWTTPSNSSANQCLGLVGGNITTSGTWDYSTNATLAAWVPYSSGTWTLTPASLTAGGLWDSLVSLNVGETVDLIVFLKQSNDWGAYFFNDVSETLGGYNTSGYQGNGTDLSHGFVLAGDLKLPTEEEVGVPEPTSLLLFVSALAALGLLRDAM